MGFRGHLLCVVAKLILVPLVAPAQTGVPRPLRCNNVRGRYAIYANGDRLWVIGSKHLLEIVSGDLDKELEKRGWETTVVYGDFEVCAADKADPRDLTIRDDVSLKGYKHLQFRIR